MGTTGPTHVCDALCLTILLSVQGKYKNDQRHCPKDYLFFYLESLNIIWLFVTRDVCNFNFCYCSPLKSLFFFFLCFSFFFFLCSKYNSCLHEQLCLYALLGMMRDFGMLNVLSSMLNL